MKLNQRVWLLIVPFVALSYVLIFSGIYHFERDSYLRNEQSRLELQMNRLSSVFVRYNGLVDGYFSVFSKSPVLQELLTEHPSDFERNAADSHLSDLVNELASSGQHGFEFIIIGADGDVKYFYNNQQDPFAEANADLVAKVTRLFEEKNPVMKRPSFSTNGSRLVVARVIDPLTMRPPVVDDWSDAIAMVLLVDLQSLDNLVDQLTSTLGYRVVFDGQHQIIPGGHNQFAIHGSKQIDSMLSLHMDFDDKRVENDLRDLMLNLIIYAFFLIIISSAIMVMMIEYYITDPVQALERDILAIDDNQVFEAGSGNDEISSLKRAFLGLYNQLKHSYDETKVLAETDSLTKLNNRRMFNSCVENLIGRSRGDDKVALIYIDLDNFKFVNDNYGHEAGDVLLIEFAEQLQSLVRMTDIVMGASRDLARLAGDEFTIILHDFDSESVLNKVANRILAIFSDGFVCSAGHFPVSASIGIAVYPRDGRTSSELISNADAAMYQAKEAGKNQYSFYSPELAAQARRDLQIEGALKTKDFSEFTMYYMPIIDAKTGEIASVEALIRWFSKEMGFVSPAEFIPIAESRGLFKDLDLWVINRVLDDFSTLQSVLGEDCRVSINISSAQLSSDVFFFDIMQAVQARGVSKNQLELEITETFAAEMSARVEANLNLFKQANFSLALDDFGAGYTSLIQLLDYPLDVIKIDKMMVDRLMGDGRNLVLALVDFCKRQGLRVIAEGVETQEQADLLREAGADGLQGFYFAKPQSLEDLAKTVALEGSRA